MALVGLKAICKPIESAFHVASDAQWIDRKPAAIQDHERERVAARFEQLKQRVLMMAIRLPYVTLDVVTIDRPAQPPARRYPHLEWGRYLHLISGHDAVYESYSARGQCLGIGTRPIEECADEPVLFEAVRPRKRVPQGGVLRGNGHQLSPDRLLSATLMAYAQALTALASTALQHFLAAFTFRAGTKAVLVLALALAGLIGTLRHGNRAISSKYKAVRANAGPSALFDRRPAKF